MPWPGGPHNPGREPTENSKRLRHANSPITALREAMSMIIAMIGTAATPLMMALQISALTGSRGVKLSAAPTSGRGRYRNIEGGSVPGPLGKGQRANAAFHLMRMRRCPRVPAMQACRCRRCPRQKP